MDTRINELSGTDRRALQDTIEPSKRDERSPDVVGRIIGRLCDEVGPDRYARYFDRQTQLSLTDDTLDHLLATARETLVVTNPRFELED